MYTSDPAPRPFPCPGSTTPFLSVSTMGEWCVLSLGRAWSQWPAGNRGGGGSPSGQLPSATVAHQHSQFQEGHKHFLCLPSSWSTRSWWGTSAPATHCLWSTPCPHGCRSSQDFFLQVHSQVVVLSLLSFCTTFLKRAQYLLLGNCRWLPLHLSLFLFSVPPNS